MGEDTSGTWRHAWDRCRTFIAHRLWFSALLAIVVFALGIGIAFWATRPPAPPSANDSTASAYNRTLSNIEAMTQKPHPSGSQQLADVRAYLLAQIKGMGLDYQVMSPVYSLNEIVADSEARNKGSKREGPPPPSGVVILPVSTEQTSSPEEGLLKEAVFDANDNITLHNVLVKLDAPGTDRGVLFMAHYDSGSNDPGAADDMTGVCALLEAMRKQAGNAHLQSDLYFLFTDGEELGAMGAKAFVRDNQALLEQISLVVNLDARGTSGGLLMFETSALDYPQVEYLQAASGRPLAYSWLPMMYRRMPNGTDLTHFLDAGAHGLNFAVAEGVENYDSPTDDIDHLDRGTAYNFLQTAFDLTDHAAGTPLSSAGNTQDGVYFTLVPGLLVVITGLVARILAGVAFLAAGALLVWQLRRGRVRRWRMLRNAALQLGVIAVAALLGWAAVSIINAEGLFRLAGEDMRFNIPAFLCIAAVISAAACAGFALLMRKQSLSDAVAGLLPLLMLATALSGVLFNAASYLFTLPTLGVALVGLLDRTPAARKLLAAAVGVGLLLLYVPVAWIIYVALGFSALPVVMVLAAIPITLISGTLGGVALRMDDRF